MICLARKARLKAAILLLVTIGLTACGSSSLRDGHQFYKEGKYEEAFHSYNQGLTKNPESEVFNYHAGIALYKKGDYEKASLHFKRVLLTENQDIEARTNYNMGNCKYRQGEQYEKTDLLKAATLYREALDYYQRAIDLNEKDDEAKQNLNLVKKKIEDILGRLPKQTPKVQKESVKSEKDKDTAPTRETFPAFGTRAFQEASQPGEVRKGQIQKQDRKILLPKDIDRQRGRNIPEMSKQEAEALLEGFRREEELSMGTGERKRKGMDPEVEKDW
jgi:tetratricopeptide (TPR) repeat protein